MRYRLLPFVYPFDPSRIVMEQNVHPVIMYYSQPFLLAKSINPKHRFCHGVNVISDGSGFWIHLEA